MRYQIFQYPIPAPGDLSELNSFLAQHRISRVSHDLVSDKNSTMLVFVVEYVAQEDRASKSSTRIDYREVLTPEDFEMFGKLREIRKSLAEAGGVPVYTIFNNAQLAKMVQEKMVNESDLGTIDGVGQTRIEKFAKPFLEQMTAFLEPEKPA